MTQYINKDAVVAEIDERIASLEGIGSENYLHDNYQEQYAMLVTLKSLKFSIDTLEVKEVELVAETISLEKAQEFFRQTPYLFKLDGIELSHFIEDFRKFVKREC